MSLRPNRTNPVIEIDVPDQEFFSLQEVADLVQCTKGNLSTAYKRGGFMEFDKRVSNKLYYSRESLIKWLSNYRPNNDPKRRSNKLKNSEYTQMDLLEESKE